MAPEPFGFQPGDAAVRTRRTAAVSAVLAFLTGNQRVSGHRAYLVEDVAVVRDLCSLPERRDRGDWALAWLAMGMPSLRACAGAGRGLVAVRRGLLDYDDALLAGASANLRSVGWLDAMATFLAGGRPRGRAHVALVSPEGEARRVRVVSTGQDLAAAVTALDVDRRLRPPLFRWCWEVRDAATAATTAANALQRYASRYRAGTFDVAVDDAIGAVDAVLRTGSRW